jgi:hypothetical protein
VFSGRLRFRRFDFGFLGSVDLKLVVVMVVFVVVRRSVGGGVWSRQGGSNICAVGEALWIRDCCSVYSFDAGYFLFCFFVCLLVFGIGGGWYKVR